ncbi:9499_t:CDS:1, partial [Racocetra persica]
MNQESAINEESSRKRHRLSLESEEFSSEAKEDTRTQIATTITTTTDTSNSQFLQILMVTQPSSLKNIPRNKHKPCSFSEVWDYFVKGVEKNNGYLY